MSITIAWIAAQSDRPDAVYRTMGLGRTGETYPDFRFPISGQGLPAGWTVVVFRDISHPLQAEDRLRTLSETHSVLRCLAGEHAMISSAEMWVAGERTWRIAHDSANGPFDLATEGDVPAAFDGIRNRQTGLQEAEAHRPHLLSVDFLFDAPLLLARQICGFKHDEWVETADAPPWDNLVISH